MSVDMKKLLIVVDPGGEPIVDQAHLIPADISGGMNAIFKVTENLCEGRFNIKLKCLKCDADFMSLYGISVAASGDLEGHIDEYMNYLFRWLETFIKETKRKLTSQNYPRLAFLYIAGLKKIFDIVVEDQTCKIIEENVRSMQKTMLVFPKIKVYFNKLWYTAEQEVVESESDAANDNLGEIDVYEKKFVEPDGVQFGLYGQKPTMEGELKKSIPIEIVRRVMEPSYEQIAFGIKVSYNPSCGKIHIDFVYNQRRVSMNLEQSFSDECILWLSKSLPKEIPIQVNVNTSHGGFSAVSMIDPAGEFGS